MIKEDLIHQFLAFVGTYIPIREARWATLGGEGTEAEIWQQAGIPVDNGWLIERNRRLNRYLAQHLPYHVCRNMGDFPGIVQAAYGAGAGIDAFHLDLNGSFEACVPDFAPVISLITSRSKGRCLAITVVEGRGTPIGNTFALMFKTAVQLIGQKNAASFLAFFTSEQENIPRQPSLPAHLCPADPQLGAQREFCLFWQLATLLCQKKDQWRCVPDHVVRYSYVSRYRLKSWRMRTYFIHFASPAQLNDRRFIEAMLIKWIDDPLRTPQDDQIIYPTTRRKEHIMPNPFPRLEAIAIAAGGEVQAEFIQLTTLAREAQSVRNIMNRMRQLLEEELSHAPAATALDTAPSSDAPSAEPSGRRRGRPRKPRPNLAEVNDELRRKVDFQLDLLRAMASGGDRAAVYRRGLELLGWDPADPAALRKIRALAAHIDGKHRRGMVRRATTIYGHTIMTEMAACYSQIHGQAVTINQLRKLL